MKYKRTLIQMDDIGQFINYKVGDIITIIDCPEPKPVCELYDCDDGSNECITCGHNLGAHKAYKKPSANKHEMSKLLRQAAETIEAYQDKGISDRDMYVLKCGFESAANLDGGCQFDEWFLAPQVHNLLINAPPPDTSEIAEYKRRLEAMWWAWYSKESRAQLVDVKTWFDGDQKVIPPVVTSGAPEIELLKSELRKHKHNMGWASIVIDNLLLDSKDHGYREQGYYCVKVMDRFAESNSIFSEVVERKCRCCTCNGQGSIKGIGEGRYTCPECDGTGRIVEVSGE